MKLFCALLILAVWLKPTLYFFNLTNKALTESSALNDEEKANDTSEIAEMSEAEGKKLEGTERRYYMVHKNDLANALLNIWNVFIETTKIISLLYFYVGYFQKYLRRKKILITWFTFCFNALLVLILHIGLYLTYEGVHISIFFYPIIMQIFILLQYWNIIVAS
jgi:hypothetical protein